MAVHTSLIVLFSEEKKTSFQDISLLPYQKILTTKTKMHFVLWLTGTVKHIYAFSEFRKKSFKTIWVGKFSIWRNLTSCWFHHVLHLLKSSGINYRNWFASGECDRNYYHRIRAVTLGTVNVSCFKWMLSTIESKTKGR